MFTKQLPYTTTSPCRQPLPVTGTAFFIFFVIAILPAILMLAGSLVVEHNLSFINYLSLKNDRVLDLFIRSSSIALGATALSLIFGLPLAFSLARTDFKARKFANIGYLIPLFIPPHIHALAWMYLLGDKGAIQLTLMHLLGASSPLTNIYSPAGATVILFLAYCPIFVLTVVTGLTQINTRVEEAASFHATPLGVLRKITLPLLNPYLFSGAIFVFIFSFFNYGVPSMLRVPSFPVEILTRFAALYDEAGAAALSAPMVILAILLLLFHLNLIKHTSIFTIDGASNTNRTPNSHLDTIAPVYVWAFIVCTVLLPLTALSAQAGSLQSYIIAWNTSSGEIQKSILLASASATLATILAYFLARTLADNNTRSGRWLNILTLLPFAIPAPLFGIGLIHLWNRPATQVVYGGYAILIIAYIARFIPFGIRIILANIQQINPSMREAACLHEAGFLKRLLYIELPLVKRGLSICWLVVFIFSMGELGATLLVIPPGAGTLSLKIYTLMHYGAGPLVAALAIILILVSLLFSSLFLKALSQK
jgi:iron(III) transport system permease protein